MENELVMIFARMFLAVMAGGLIGLERSFHGRAAGFRTHTLVCLASALLLLLTDSRLIVTSEAIRMDPLRTVQGIMTGIGFLGAGVILKEGASIRGLTTAASIWITAAIGIAIGNGNFILAFLAAGLTLVTLVIFRWIENSFPGHRWALLTVRLSRTAGFRELALQELIRENGAWAKESGYHVESGGNILICEMNVHTRKKGDFYKLAEALKNADWVRDFNLTIASR